MKSEDLAKFFLPYIHEGKWIDGTQLIPAEWVKEATKQSRPILLKTALLIICAVTDISSGAILPRTATDAMAYSVSAVLCFPDYNALVVLNSGESEDYKIMKVFWKHFPKCFKENPLPENDTAHKALFKGC